LIIYYSRVVHGRPHAVYLYYLRYFLSEILIIYLLVLCAFLYHGLRSGIIFKVISLLFVFTYFVQSAYWLSLNGKGEYLENAYEILSEVSSVIPYSKSAIFTDVHYDGKWVYPGFDECFLSPLRNSFGYRVIKDGKPKNPYNDPYNKKRLNNLISNPDKPVSAYILSISRTGDREPPDFGSLKGTLVSHAERIKSFVKIKGHNPGNIFKKGYSRHDIVIDIYKVDRFFVFPYRGRFTKRSGFFHKSIWTKGSASISGFEYHRKKNDNFLVLGTFGYNPFKNKLDKLKLSLEIENLPLLFSHKSKNEYYFHLPKDIEVFSDIAIKSSTFVPKEHGINNSVKNLGIDVKYLTVK
jgi:hypothetical protein